jgi:uncharacterized protein (TIGR03118 family)
MRTWFRNLWRRLRRPAADRPRPSCHPTLEALEARYVPTGTFVQVNLVADRPGFAVFTDPNLVNSWGITASMTSPFWVADNGTGLATLYVFGNPPSGSSVGKQSLVVIIPLPPGGMPPTNPTGIAFNGNMKDFFVSANGKSGPAAFLFVTEDGTISGWNPMVDGTHAILKISTLNAAVYKGLALGSTSQGDFLYATDFRQGFVEMFNSNFGFTGRFTDPGLLSHGFAPFNIANVNGLLYVTFAKQNKAKHDDVAGPGNGFVDVFTPSGQFLGRLISRGHLNSPWGMAIAPPGFGQFGGALLVGNFGDGHINAYNPFTGQFLGQLHNARNHPLVIDGLWGLRFGNNAAAGSSNILFFTAGPDHEMHGLLGALVPF